MFLTDATGTPPRSIKRGAYLHISLFRAFVAAFLLLGSWLLIFVWGSSRPTHPASALGRASTIPQAASQLSPAQPWGDLEVTPITLEPPTDYAARFSQADTSIWYFRDTTRESLGKVLTTAGLTAEQRDGALAKATPDGSISGFAVRPDRSLVLALSPEVRTALYLVLGADPKNAQAEPFRHRYDANDEWFADAGLRESTVALVRKLVYRRGDLEVFSDVSTVTAEVTDEAERAKLFRALAQQSALMVKLRLRPGVDVRALTSYWGNGGREQEIGPLIESLARLPDGFSVSISQLLPRFPRARAYTYPEPLNGSTAGSYDCHWTSLNFWNHPTVDRFTNPEIVGQELASAYHTVERPSQLGDIVFFLNDKGQGIHSAAYVADDIVFTKNGSNIASPWMLTRLGDLITYYETVGTVKTVIFRKNAI